MEGIPSQRLGTSIGFEAMRVVITLITNQGQAHTIDSFGRERVIPINTTTGRWPREHEVWAIKRVMDNWVFDRVLRASPPIIVGNRSGTAMANLLAALDADEVIVDQTTDGGGGGDGGEIHWSQGTVEGDVTIAAADGIVPILNIESAVFEVTTTCIDITCFLPAVQITGSGPTYGLLTVVDLAGPYVLDTAYLTGAAAGETSYAQGWIYFRFNAVGEYTIEPRLAVLGTDGVLTIVAAPTFRAFQTGVPVI